MSNFEFKVIWFPQLPCKPFEVEMPDLDTATLMCDTLAMYDLFQFEHNIKPDYSNGGYIRYSHPMFTDGEWWEVDPDDEYGMEDLNNLLAEEVEL